MEIKKVMIDGVDVNRCIDFNKRDKVSCYHILYDKCNESPNCYFKQLARKTQECEQIKEKYEALKLENQEGYEIVDELKQECEQLKDKLKIYEKMMDNPEFTVALTDIRTGERDIQEQYNKRLIKENDRYRKALEEIEGIAKNFGSYAAWQEQQINKILDIINKAKGEDND